MSVRVSERSEGKLQVLNCSRNLAKYTIEACKSDKNFPKTQRWILPHRLVDEVLNVSLNIKKANSIPLYEMYNERFTLQHNALASLESMLEMIDLAESLYGLESNKVMYWTSLIVDTEQMLRSWINSDKSRYEKFLTTCPN